VVGPVGGHGRRETATNRQPASPVFTGLHISNCPQYCHQISKSTKKGTQTFV
jgi:hypothetical protein